jgi:23S rRNA (uracil1939-C5)-methyltransferase
MAGFEVEIAELDADGIGVGWHGKRRVLIPYTIPGERVLVEPLAETEKGIRARGVRLIEASADRVQPRCIHFGQGRCGLCRWQHIDVRAQPLLKQDAFAEMLSRLGRLSDRRIEAALRPILPAPEAWGYNQHITFQVTQTESGAQLGFPDTDGGIAAPIVECHTSHPALWTFYEALDLDLTGLRRVRLARGSDGALMLILTLTTEEAPEIETDAAASVNLILPDNEPMNLIGDSHLRYVLDALSFRVTAGSFIRPNIGALPGMIRAVIELLDPQPSERILDLYAGVGIYSAFIAPRASLVTLVESYPPAVTDADINLAGFDNVDVIEGGVDAVLPALEGQYAAAVVDPPGRFGGLTDATVSALVERGVRRLIYVSEEPAILARDCRKLGKAGFQLTAAQPVDLAPQTAHFEAAARFER